MPRKSTKTSKTTTGRQSDEQPKKKEKKPYTKIIEEKIEERKKPQEALLTYKIKHHQDFSDELVRARKLAEYVVQNKHDKELVRSSANLKQFGLPSAISNQIGKKYSKSGIKMVSSVKLTVPGQSVPYVDGVLKINCLKLHRKWAPGRPIKKVNQVEVGPIYIMITVTIDVPEFHHKAIKHPVYGCDVNVIGVDLNCTHHIAVASNLATGKVYKFGKQGPSIRKRYFKKRRYWQQNKMKKPLKKLGNRETRRTNDLDHKIARKLVDIAYKTKSVLVLEDLTGIRKKSGKKSNKPKCLRRFINCWPFWRLRKYITYKAALLNIPVYFIDPAYTSQLCSRCIHLGRRYKKDFKCKHCGHKDHADSNAGFNIGRRWLVKL